MKGWCLDRLTKGPSGAFCGTRTHNLKNIDLTLPRDKLIVITGLSGSGKSSLAFDTLYAEGQRRYVESLSAYARQFLSMMVPTVERGLCEVAFCSMEMAGDRPSIRSTSGFSISCRNWRA